MKATIQTWIFAIFAGSIPGNCNNSVEPLEEDPFIT